MQCWMAILRMICGRLLFVIRLLCLFVYCCVVVGKRYLEFVSTQSLMVLQQQKKQQTMAVRGHLLRKSVSRIEFHQIQPVHSMSRSINQVERNEIVALAIR